MGNDGGVSSQRRRSICHPLRFATDLLTKPTTISAMVLSSSTSLGEARKTVNMRRDTCMVITQLWKTRRQQVKCQFFGASDASIRTPNDQPSVGENSSIHSASRAAWEKEQQKSRNPCGLRLLRLTCCRLHLLDAFDEGLQLAAAAGMPQLAQRLGFDLADAVSGDLEALADFFQRVLGAVFQAEAHLDDPLLARRERAQNLRGVLLEVHADDRDRK